MAESQAQFTHFNPDFAVAPQLAADDMAAVAAAGFRSVINNRPDGEGGPSQPSNAEIEQAARALGLEYRYQPVNGAAILPQDVQTFAELVETLPGPVLAFCRTGTRCGNLFRLASAQ